MLVINEILPNPVGKDADGEFIELYNPGDTVNLRGFYIKDKSGKTFKLSGSMPPQSFRVFTFTETKISLNNSNEEIYLYDGDGNLISKAAFLGEAREGASLSSFDGNLVFSDLVTPGFANQMSPVSINNTALPFVAPPAMFGNSLTFFNLAAIMLFIALFAGAGAVYLMKLFHQ